MNVIKFTSALCVACLLAAALALGRASNSQIASPNDAASAAAHSPTRPLAHSPSWYRGNIHTHSLWSDGDDYPDMIVDWYKEHGYQFLALSDHNVLSRGERWIDVEDNRGGRAAFERYRERFGDEWVQTRTTGGTPVPPGNTGETPVPLDRERLEVRLRTFDEMSERFNEPGRFLLLQGEEITDRFRNLPVHLNATNLEEFVPPMGGDSVYEVMQNNVNAVIAQRERTGRPMIVHLNHPNFGWGVTAEDLMRVFGERFFEVYNGHRSVRNYGDADHPSTERMWDIILTRRLAELEMEPMYGLAVDDAHNHHEIPGGTSNPGRGWIMVRAAELTAEAIIEAMERGHFYASTGVTLDDVRFESGRLEIEIAAEPGVTYTTEFVGTREDYDPAHESVVNDAGEALDLTHRYSEEIGEVLAEVEGPRPSYTLRGDEIYVRARVVSSRPHPNPFLPGDLETAWVQPVVGPAARSRP